MKPVLVLNVVGLTRELLRKFSAQMPNLSALAGKYSAVIEHVAPAVTCPVQATYLTGLWPREHGIVANGWYDRESAEVAFWRQSNRLMSGEKIWEAGRKRDRKFTSAQLFWWFNMYSTNDYAVTPRPEHQENDALISLTYTNPPKLSAELDEALGRFPLFDFWGPNANINSSRWIAEAALFILKKHAPTLTLVYLPHLDYNLQRLGPNDPKLADDLAAADALVGKLQATAGALGMTTVVLSEYGMHQTTDAVHINRILRRAGLLRATRRHTWEILDAGASRAFAVSDHQVAHVYVADPADLAETRDVLEKADGVARVLGPEEIRAAGLDHARSGDLVALSAPDRWFSYYYWEDSALAPGWTREVEIHRKPGYDPLELFMDPRAPLKIPRIFWRLLKRSLGFRTTVMDFVPYDTTLVRGSHGLRPEHDEELPVFMADAATEKLPKRLKPTEVKESILKLIFGESNG
jgi:predicted AlkP superfamily pyrophosphatase or phosphodiesterase